MRRKYVVVAALACAVAGMGALAQQKVPGDKWRMKIAMQTEGFSMPATTQELCIARGQPETAMMQQDSKNCAVSNMKTSGNKTSADIRCTGKDAMEGRFEIEKLGENSMRGTMNARNDEMSMQMNYEYTKLPQACEAVDYSNYKPPVVDVPQVDACQLAHDQVKERGAASMAVAMLQSYPDSTGKMMASCTNHAAFRNFCSTLATPAGFADLEQSQFERRAMKIASNAKPADAVQVAPLTESMRACGLGTGDAAVARLQKQVLAAAQADRQWGFLLFYAGDEFYPQLATTAKQQCSGRSFTNAANRDFLGLCRNYGTALVRDNRQGVMETAGCSAERVNTARGICIGATGSGSGTMARMSDTNAEGSSGSAAAVQAETADPAAAADKSTKDKAKDALDKGKKALRGLLGGG